MDDIKILRASSNSVCELYLEKVIKAVFSFQMSRSGIDSNFLINSLDRKEIDVSKVINSQLFSKLSCQKFELCLLAYIPYLPISFNSRKNIGFDKWKRDFQDIGFSKIFQNSYQEVSIARLSVFHFVKKEMETPWLLRKEILTRTFNLNCLNSKHQCWM